MQQTSTLPSTGAFSGYDRLQLTFAYDWLGRRVRKEVFNLRTSTVKSARRYGYDGWNLIAEFDESSGAIGALQRSYTWGLDQTGSLAATGGVGALVQLSVHNGSTVTDYYPTYDANGNVAALVKNDGTLAAAYEYDPFGQSLRNDVLDSAVADNPFRFSTKFTDVETGLVYYGQRYYSPSLGRFISKDPIAEQGGLNLYAFVGNDPVNAVDVLGMDGEPASPKGESLPGACLDENGMPIPGCVPLPPFYADPGSDDGPYGSASIGHSQGGGPGAGPGSQTNPPAPPPLLPPEVIIPKQAPNKSPYAGLPPCSQIRKQIASGELKPNVTVQSFIEGQTAWGFRGDGRGFVDSPANGSAGQTYRTSVSYTYGDANAVASQGVSSVAVPNPLGNGAFLPPDTIARRGTATGSGSAFVDRGGTYYFNVSGSGSDGLLPGIAPPARQSAYVTVNYNTGVIGGFVDNTVFPATQVFLNGKSILNYSAEDNAKNPGDLGAPMTRTFISGYACDPTK